MGTNSLTLNRCRVCQLTKEQHLLIECDTCGHYYHLSCLDPPLTRMPKKTKQMGWQCSDCCKSSDSDKAPEVDTAAPRRLRRNIKEPAKFSPSLVSETKGNESGEKSQMGTTAPVTVMPASVTPSTDDKPPVHLYHPGVASVPGPPEEPPEAATIAGKRRRSSDGKKATPKKQKKSPGDTEHSSSENVPVNTLAEPIPTNKMSPTTAAARGKKGPPELPPQDTVQISQLETRSARGRKLHPEPQVPIVSVQCTVSTAAPTATTMSLPERPTTAVAQTTDTLSPSKNRRGQADSTQPPGPSQATCSPSRQRRQPPEASEAPRPHISSPTRSRRHQVEPSAETLAEPQQPVPPQTESEAAQGSGSLQAPASENVEPISRRRGASSIQLDTSVESLPSVTSLHSPTSESFHSAEDDPSSPRKEKRHRDGSKKKKKDKDKEVDGVKKRKKHHHRDKHGLGEMASEIVTPFRIKIKPLPPRPLDEAGQGVATVPPASTTSQASSGALSLTTITSATSTTTTTITTTATTATSTTASSSGTTTSLTTTSSSSTLVSHSSYQTRTPPAGYPPLPPGYTLTQPMAPPSSASSNTSSTTTTTHYPSSTSSQVSTSHVSTFSSGGSSSNRRRSDPSDPQQFSKCDVCGETGGVTNTVSCDECNKAYHFNCLEPPLKKSPKRRGYSWFCEDCDSAVSTINLAHIQWNINVS